MKYTALLLALCFHFNTASAQKSSSKCAWSTVPQRFECSNGKAYASGKLNCGKNNEAFCPWELQSNIKSCAKEDGSETLKCREEFLAHQAKAQEGLKTEPISGRKPKKFSPPKDL